MSFTIFLKGFVIIQNEIHFLLMVVDFHVKGVSKINMCLFVTRTLKASTYIGIVFWTFSFVKFQRFGGANQIVVSIRLLVPLIKAPQVVV